MSSYQLELTLSITFDIAVLMNITPDHIDRHGGFDGYVTAKRQIFHRQTKPRTAHVGVDDPTSGCHYEERKAPAEKNDVGTKEGGTGGNEGYRTLEIRGSAVQLKNTKPKTNTIQQQT